MSDAPVTTTIEDGVAVLRFDDGKVNALSYAALDALSAGLDQAAEAASAVCIVGRDGTFSAGFDLSVMTQGLDAALGLVRRGGELFRRLVVHPQPVVAAVTGHALAGGVLLAASCDVRIGADRPDRPAKIGLNETAIGMSLPGYAVELARERLSPTAFLRATVGAELYDAPGAAAVGWLDWVVPATDCASAAVTEARRLGALSGAAYAQTKRMARQPLLDRIAEATTREDFRLE